MKNSSLLLILFYIEYCFAFLHYAGKGGDRLVRIAQFKKTDLRRHCFLLRIVLLS